MCTTRSSATRTMGSLPGRPLEFARRSLRTGSATLQLNTQEFTPAASARARSERHDHGRLSCPCRWPGAAHGDPLPTSVGVCLSLVSPRPSSPLPLKPQAQSVPFIFTAKVSPSPQETPAQSTAVPTRVGVSLVVVSPRPSWPTSVSYTHLRAHETRHDLVCRLL